MINYIRIYHAVPLIPSAPTSCAPHSMACALNMKTSNKCDPWLLSKGSAKTSCLAITSLFSVCTWSFVHFTVPWFRIASGRILSISNSFDAETVMWWEWRKFSCQVKKWLAYKQLFVVEMVFSLIFSHFGVKGWEGEFAFHFVSTFSWRKCSLWAKWSIIKLNYLMINLGMHTLKLYKVEEVRIVVESYIEFYRNILKYRDVHTPNGKKKGLSG